MQGLLCHQVGILDRTEAVEGCCNNEWSTQTETAGREEEEGELEEALSQDICRSYSLFHENGRYYCGYAERKTRNRDACYGQKMKLKQATSAQKEANTENKPRSESKLFRVSSQIIDDLSTITQQTNNFDCGVHVLYIITKMIEAEKDGKLLEYLEKGGLPEEWETAEIVANYRQEVRDLFTSLVESDT
ncbi:hypothetical protein R1sor_019348 [Riccia sorocarpa]|uniref:Ubiquitin-like protease family profile domain-containing protein n=1 Tax=Riccia sorocarpa TaxID=122646 RepID=A0ABD3IDC8_9MARC